MDEANPYKPFTFLFNRLNLKNCVLMAKDLNTDQYIKLYKTNKLKDKERYDNFLEQWESTPQEVTSMLSHFSNLKIDESILYNLYKYGWE